MNACFIIGAGPFYGLPVVPGRGDFIIAADGGYRHCQEAGLTPNLLLGDFDSLDTLPPSVEVLRYPVDKDDTDSMLALKLGLDRGFTTFHIYGGTGGRMDHTLANLQGLAYLAQRGAKGYLYDQTFAVIRSKGDQALFRLSTNMMKRKMGMPQSRPLADFLPTISIKAKDFAAEMTSVNVQTKDLHGEVSITKEHVDNNAAVRKMLTERGIIPEDLPAAEDVKKVERRLASEEKKMLGNKK